MRQPDLFRPTPFNIEAASTLPTQLRFGTSSWTYPGWKGLIYSHQYSSEKSFRSECLREYAGWPLFRTVGIDSSFYKPLSSDILAHYSSCVPEHFQWISKVWERITTPKFPRLPRYGSLAGAKNTDFLNATLFCEKVLGAYRRQTTLARHAGPFVFQFPQISSEVLTRLQFMERLDQFLAALPEEFRYACEIRNPEYLSSEYFRILNTHRVTHCFNHWDKMPSLRTQMKHAAAAGGLQAGFYVARILTPLGIPYKTAVERFSPYDQIKQPNPDMRQDIIRLARRAIDTNVPAFVIVNNRAEGNSPMTIDAIIREIVGS